MCGPNPSSSWPGGPNLNLSFIQPSSPVRLGPNEGDTVPTIRKPQDVFTMLGGRCALVWQELSARPAGGQMTKRWVSLSQQSRKCKWKPCVWHFHLRNWGRSLPRITAALASLHAGTHNSWWTHVNRGTNFLRTLHQSVSGALWMFVLFEPRILLLGIDLTEIITGTDQDLCTRKLITGLFITWEKTGNNPTSQQARKEETNYKFWGHPCHRLESNHWRPWFWWML